MAFELQRKKTASQKKDEAWRIVCELADLTSSDLDISRGLLQSYMEEARELVNSPTWGVR